MWMTFQIFLTFALLYAIGSIVYKGRNHGEGKSAFVRVLVHFLLLLVVSGVVLGLLTAVVLLSAALVDVVFYPQSVDIPASGNLATLIGRFPTASFLFGLLILIFGSAIVHYLLRRMVLRRFPTLALDGDDYEICEYFIQWMTIYLAVYQFFFDGLNKIIAMISTANDAAEIFNVLLTPTNINLLLQPLLITTWVVVVMEKLRARHEESTNA